MREARRHQNNIFSAERQKLLIKNSVHQNVLQRMREIDIFIYKKVGIFIGIFIALEESLKEIF